MADLPASRRAPAIVQLTWIHAASLGADAILTVSLAGTLFFTVATSAARPRVLLYLLLTMTPFAIVAPVVGPVIDRLRHWRRLVVGATFVGRAVLCVLMAHAPSSLLIYPEAFGVLLLSKCYLVAKGAIVPAFVRNQRALVNANARLARTALVAGALAGLLAAAIFHLGGAAWTLRVAAVVYVVGVVLAVRLPKSGPEEEARVREADENTELRTQGSESARRRIVLAASAMGLLRGAVGFLTFLIVFSLKEAREPSWFYGLVIVASGLGAFAGASVAPPLRRRISEETLMTSALVVPAVGAVIDLLQFGRTGIPVVAFALGVAASAARVAFDSLVQQYSPDAARGRAFARFETRFQVTWVVGSALAVVLHLDLTIGLVVLSVGLLVATASYVSGTRAARSIVSDGPAARAGDEPSRPAPPV